MVNLDQFIVDEILNVSQFEWYFDLNLKLKDVMHYLDKVGSNLGIFVDLWIKFGSECPLY